MSAPPPTRGPSDGIADSLLRAAADAIAAGETPPDDPRLFWRGQQVLVQITHDVPLPDVTRTLAGFGGEVATNIGGGYLEAWVPVQRLAAVAASRGIVAIEAPTITTVDYGSKGTEPIGKVKATAWQTAGWNGTGVKVGIIDFFDAATWNAAANAGEVPSSPAGVFCQAGEVSCNFWSYYAGGTQQHGTAVAEVIKDLAPSSTLYLAYAVTAGDTAAAINYFVSQGVRIISRSLGNQYDGPGDGTGPYAQVVDTAVANGITFFNAAGNEARGYWRGPWSDADGDGWLEFGTAGELMGFNCDFVHGLRWSDWGTQRTDYNVYIFDTEYSYTPEGQSTGDQLYGGLSPIERPSWTCSGDSDVDYIGVYLNAAGSGTAGDVLELMVSSVLELYTSPYSASGPVVDSKNVGAIAVGAVDPWDGTTIAWYSSRGPTNDSRIKPDLSAPSCFPSYTYYPNCFNGTSAATPVAAGTAALVLQAYPSATPATLGSWLRRSAVVDRGTAGVDNTYGAGELSLPTPPSTAVTSPTVTLTKSGAGTGSVTSNPAGISCGATCSAVFPGLASVTLTATADPGSTFAGWSGACTGTGSCVLSMTASRSVTATFTTVYALTVTKAGTGSGTVTSSPAGISCGATCSASFTSGTSVTLTATPAAGSTFAGWSGNCTGTSTCVLSMTAAKSATATFNAIVYALTVTKAGTGSGTVTSSPAGISCGSTCSASFTSGTSVTLTATPAAGSTFAGWSGACTGTSTCVLSMTVARSATATFTAVPLILNNGPNYTPVTDNYKAIYNANPDTRETRTWLQMRTVLAGTVTFTPTTLPAAGTRSFVASVPVTGSDGTLATVEFGTAASGVTLQSFRIESNGIWGPILTLNAAYITANYQPIPVTINVRSGGVIVSSRTLYYRYDANLFNAPRSLVAGNCSGLNCEWNGPSGRWWQGCQKTGLDWETVGPYRGSCATDFNGDRRDDLGVFYDYGANSSGVYTSGIWTFSGSETTPVVSRPWLSTTSFNAASSKPITGDFDGDGATDYGVLYSTSSGPQLRIWYSSGWSGLGDPITFSSVSLTWAKSTPVTGDFNGDGRVDIAIFYDYGLNSSGVYESGWWVMYSTGRAFAIPTVPQWKSTGGWNGTRSKPVAGDFDGDGKADLGVFYDYGQNASGNYISKFWVWYSSGSAFSAPAIKWEVPSSSTTSFSWSKSTLTSGDFDGDGIEDLGIFYDKGSATSLFTVFRGQSNKTILDRVNWWTSAAGAFDALKSKPTAADLNNDGRSDLVVLYDYSVTYGTNTSGIRLLLSTGTALSTPTDWWRSGTGSFAWSKTKVPQPAGW